MCTLSAPQLRRFLAGGLALLSLIVSGTACAQFELPPAAAAAAASGAAGATGAPGGFGIPAQVPTRLSYQYAYGMESPFTYRRNNDLDSGLRDNQFLFKTKIFGNVVYRPVGWLSLTLEMKLGREYSLAEEDLVQLPNGDTFAKPRRDPTLVVEQALITVRQIIAPFELNIGRRNYEDDRHWIFDGSMDVVSLAVRQGDWRAEVMVGRDVLWSLDALRHTVKPGVESTMLWVDYRGVQDHLISAYALKRSDRDDQEGHPLTLGLRANGKPTATVNWWGELALLRGRDENGQRFKARALDVGATYRFADLPLDPNITLAYAYGSGDSNPDDGVNREFRQTGLQTNETKYIGLSKFKAYGERLDSELSNLKVLAVGLGARLSPGTTVDVIYRRYRLDTVASEIRNWGLTAQMNTLPDQPSRDMGQALDVVMGFRGLFDIRRLGLDLRAGWFFPGKAFRRAQSAPARNADKGVSVIGKFRY
jgi:alginate production protein